MTLWKLILPTFFFMCWQAFGQTSLWPNSAIPKVPQVSSTAAVTVGLRFYTSDAGYITGVRFYKGSRNTGTHIGALWTSSGTQLATVTFTGETASGWQQAKFATPVSVAKNMIYIVSYTAPSGSHAEDQNYNWASLNVLGLVRTIGSPPSVLTYGSGVQFPKTSSSAKSNYWVDVIFSSTKPTPAPAPVPAPTTYNISGNVRGSSATLTLSGSASRSTTTDASGNYSFTGLAKGTYAIVPTRSGYLFTPPTTVVTISNAALTGINFTGSVVPVPIQRTVVLSWKASTTPNIKGYHVYRAAVAGGAFVRLTTTPLSATTYTDRTVASGRIYYYVTTAVSSNNIESARSNQAIAVIPEP